MIHLQQQLRVVLDALLEDDGSGVALIDHPVFARQSDPANSMRVAVSRLRRIVGIDVRMVRGRDGKARYSLSHVDRERAEEALGLASERGRA